MLLLRPFNNYLYEWVDEFSDYKVLTLKNYEMNHVYERATLWILQETWISCN